MENVLQGSDDTGDRGIIVADVCAEFNLTLLNSGSTHTSV